MAEPYIGEIRMFAGNFAPAGWKFCNGELLPIADNEALFALMGTCTAGMASRHSRFQTCVDAFRFMSAAFQAAQ